MEGISGVTDFGESADFDDESDASLHNSIGSISFVETPRSHNRKSIMVSNAKLNLMTSPMTRLVPKTDLDQEPANSGLLKP